MRDQEWAYLEEKVILDVMDVFARPHGSFPEIFVSLSLILKNFLDWLVGGWGGVGGGGFC